ncbi:MAG TPA: GNAT family N-acetyltransferase [Candidatus Brevibacterium intestinigallinarum]|nr:GNAT family N-acetyltransferase [Candidatus Brevibacterium intestinigallinarum]
MEIRIAQIEPAHAAASRTVIARAFADDPLLEWLFPPARWAVDERLDAIAMFYGPTVDAYAVAQTGHVALQGETVVGVGLWGVPGSVPVAGAGGPALLPTGAGVARILLGERAGLLGHGLRSARGAEPVPRTPYLHDLAVSGGLRGRGIGARLVAAGIAEHGADGAWLESTNPRNRTLYERAGFRTVHEGVVGDSGVTMARMVLPPEVG